ncbi:hypothetical protein RCL1_005034 [Eukaryota sp. TZLM3-RCL]
MYLPSESSFRILVLCFPNVSTLVITSLGVEFLLNHCSHLSSSLHTLHVHCKGSILGWESFGLSSSRILILPSFLCVLSSFSFTLHDTWYDFSMINVSSLTNLSFISILNNKKQTQLKVVGLDSIPHLAHLFLSNVVITSSCHVTAELATCQLIKIEQQSLVHLFGNDRAFRCCELTIRDSICLPIIFDREEINQRVVVIEYGYNLPYSSLSDQSFSRSFCRLLKLSLSRLSNSTLSLSFFPRLQSLSIDHSSISSCFIFNLPLLYCLTISSCSSLTILSLSDLPQLCEVSVNYCGNLIDFEYQLIPTLSSVLLFGCNQLSRIQFSDCLNLKELSIIGCEEIRRVVMSNLPVFDCFRLINCRLLTDLIIRNVRLASLYVDNCNSLPTIQWDGVTSLQSLSIHQCRDLKELALNHFDLSMLSSIDLFLCNKLTKILIENSTSLTKLKLSSCFDLPFISHLIISKLKEISINDCNSLPSLSVSHIVSLETLSIHGCSKIKTVKLSFLESLKTISLARLNEFVSFSFHNVPLLKRCHVSQAPKLCDISPFGSLYHLERVEVLDCRMLQELVLSNLTSLQVVDVSQCCRLKYISFKGENGLLEKVAVEVRRMTKDEQLSSFT